MALVADQYGNPVSGQGVLFAVTGGGGSVSNAGAATTIASGIASINWTLGSAFGGQTMTATLNPNPNTVASATFTASVQLPAGTTVVAGTPSTASGTAGGTSTNVCAVVNVNSAAVAGVPVTFTVPGGNTSIFIGSNPVTTSGSPAQACTTVTLTHTAGTFNVTASVATINNGTASGAIPMTVNAGPLTQLQIISGNNQAALTSSPVPNPLVAQASDQYGNGISGVSITFSAPIGSGEIINGGTACGASSQSVRRAATLTCGPTVTTGSNGQASVTLTLGSTIGANTVTATATGATSVTFTATGGKTMTLSNTAFGFVGVGSLPLTITSGGGSIAWSASNPGQSWVSLSAYSGTTPQTIMINVDPGTLPTGAYAAAITITGTGASNSPQTINIGLTVQPPGVLGLSQVAMNFIGAVGSSLPAQPLLIFGGASFPTMSTRLSAATTTGGNWLSVTPPSGSTPLTGNVAVSTTGLAAGTYNGTITVTSASATNSPLLVSVTLTLTNAPQIVSSPTSLSFTGVANGASPVAQTIGLTNPGSGSLVFAATATTTSGGNWLSVSGGGTNTATLTVSASIGTLGAGTYSGSIAVTAAGASNTPLNIPVTLTVSGGPQFTFTPASLNFAGTVSAANPAPQTITLANSGAGSLVFAATAATTSGGSWLSVTGGGTNTATLTVSASTGTLGAGIYSGSIVVTAPGASNSPQTIPVTFTVASATAASALGSSAASLLFTTTTVGTTPVQQTFTVVNAGGTAALGFTAVASTSNGGNWLTITPSTGVTPQTITVTVTGAVGGTNLPQGGYNGTITISSVAGSAASNTITVPVGLAVNAPAIQPGGLVSAAIFNATVSSAPSSRCLA